MTQTRLYTVVILMRTFIGLMHSLAPNSDHNHHNRTHYTKPNLNPFLTFILKLWSLMQPFKGASGQNILRENEVLTPYV